VRVRSSLGADQSIERGIVGDVLGVTDATSGFEARFERDQLGLELERTLPGGVRSRWRRDAVGRPLEHLVGAGENTLRAVGYKWDVNDRLRMLVDGLKGTTEYRHDALGNLAWAKYANGELELRMPDAVGNLFRTEHRGDRKYGPAGQLLVSSTPRGETRYTYDPEGNLLEKREPDGRIWSLRVERGGDAREGHASRRQRRDLRLRRARQTDREDVSRADDALGVGRQRAAARVGRG
jgi:YD repeat-containing protein